jgi:PIN domain nuclease of toxin-antitoxin system
MASPVVFDTSALLTLTGQEPGVEEVEAYIVEEDD